MKKIISAILLIASIAACHPFDDYIVGEGEITGRIDNIDVDWISGLVEIGYWDGATIKFYEECSETLPADQTLCWYQYGHTLRIRHGKNGRVAHDKALHVLLPQGSIFEDLEVNTTSADVICDIDCDEVDIETTSGKVSFYTLKRRTDVEIETVSGDVVLGLPSDQGFYLDYTTLSGKLHSDFRLSGQNSHFEYLSGGPSFDVTTVSGNLDLIIND